MPRVLVVGGVDVTAAVSWAEETVGPISGARELVGGWTSTMVALSGDGRDDVVLRLMTREPWRTHGAGLTARESAVQRMLADTSVPAPRTLALDADGRSCGFPAHLMTLLPGAVDHVGGAAAGPLVDLLATIHEVVPTIDVRAYESWAWEAKFEPPPWAADRRLWLDAFALLRTDPPAFRPCFIHRDFQPRNVLWSAGRISGVVDWVETSTGPAWLDVAHCSTNIAIVSGNEAADAFAVAYTERTGRGAEPYFDVMDVVGFLPPPGRKGFFDDDGPENRRLEDRLRTVAQRVR
jgi:aminoglycoside phosphotransferase (APT) family kinase protein